MNELQEYSSLCDLVYSVSQLNIRNSHICNTQQDVVTYLEKNKDKNLTKQVNEMDNPYILHFQEEYTDMTKLLSTYDDLTEHVIPYSNYLTSVVNNYLLEVTMKYMSFSSDEKSNLTILIKFYEFSVNYITSYYSYQKQLETLISFPDERRELKTKAKLDMKKGFDYDKLCDIYRFLFSFKENVDFSKKSDEYKDYSENSRKLVKPLHKLVNNLLSVTEKYVKDVDSFLTLNVNDRIDIMIPFMNIIQFILYILVKNDK
jgi:hypothetical protein